jgi:hypothetical protein|tara:strand:+ start:942 stop:1382 length:441 start_codon:yes stop_codon:yes gene_type:complete
VTNIKKGFGIFAIGIVLIGISTVGTLLIGDSSLTYCADKTSDTGGVDVECLKNAAALFKVLTITNTLGFIFALTGIYTEVANVLESRGTSLQRESRRPIQKHDNASSRLIKNKNNPEFDFVCTACNKEFKEFWNKCPSCGGFVDNK